MVRRGGPPRPPLPPGPCLTASLRALRPGTAPAQWPRTATKACPILQPPLHRLILRGCAPLFLACLIPLGGIGSVYVRTASPCNPPRSRQAAETRRRAPAPRHRHDRGGAPCADIAMQIQAVEKAMAAAKRTLIHDHIDHCLTGERAPICRDQGPGEAPVMLHTPAQPAPTATSSRRRSWR